MVETSLSGSGEGPGASPRPGLLDVRHEVAPEPVEGGVHLVKS